MRHETTIHSPSLRLRAGAFLSIAIGSASLGAPAALAQIPEIEEIGIHIDAHWIDGVPRPQPLRFELEVCGDNLNTITVQTPGGAVHPLVFDASADEWRYEKDFLADLCAVENDPDIGFGDFFFSFNGGIDVTAVTFDPGTPTCTTPPHTGYGDLVFPAHQHANVDLFPTITWSCTAGPCGSFGWFAELYVPGGGGAEYETDILDPQVMAWTPPGCLTPSSSYMLYLGSGSVLGGAVQNLLTVQLDAFVYVPGYATINEIAFDTRAAIATSYCASAPNSVGPGAVLCAAGSDVAADQDLTLVAAGCPEDVPGLFYFGPTQIQVPFGEGFRCVGGMAGTIKRMYPFAFCGPMNGSPAGTAVRGANFAAGYAGSFVPSASLNFQYWYRDVMGGLNGFNLTDAVQIVWQ